jgi:hypothetical protein
MIRWGEAAGIVVMVGCASAGPGVAQSSPLKASRDASLVTVVAGEKQVLTYRHGDAPFKPYIRTLSTPSGIQVLRDSPSDHVHHRGIMFAVEANKADFWAETDKSGKQVPDGGVEAAEEPGRTIRIAQKLKWIPAGGQKPVLVEDRSISVYAGVPGATLLTWRTRIKPAEGVETVSITGSHYQGLGMRFVTSMDGPDTFLHASGAVGPVVRGSEHVTPSSWSAYAGSVEGKPVTAALFDHPKNARAPAGMFTMFKPFSYLSATPNVWKQPLELKAGETLDLRYGVAVLDGAAGREQLESLHKAWLALAGE